MYVQTLTLSRETGGIELHWTWLPQTAKKSCSTEVGGGERERERERERKGRVEGEGEREGWEREKDREINQFLYLYHTQETSVPMSKHSPPFGSLANSLSLDVPIRHIILTKCPAQTADLVIGVINKRLHHDLIMRVSTSARLKITHANVVRFCITRCSISHALTRIFCLKAIMPCY